MGLRDGDGWVACHCGTAHWGLYGAAGLLLVRLDLSDPHVLLQLRAGWTHGGGTWALPGGAMDSHEDPVAAAAREAHEEAGIDLTSIVVREVFSDDHGNWGYHTVIAHAHGDAGAHEANGESEAVRWVHLDEVHTYALHPGFAASWTALHPLVRATLDP
jgi:8-oxo-dGTP diphosphatase